MSPRPVDCQCDAWWSGRDEAEYCARGCPSCSCGNMEETEIIFREVPGLATAPIKLHKDLIQQSMDEHMVKTSSAKKL